MGKTGAVGELGSDLTISAERRSFSEYFSGSPMLVIVDSWALKKDSRLNGRDRKSKVARNTVKRDTERLLRSKDLGHEGKVGCLLVCWALW